MMHLHTRSMYSLLESPFRPEQIANVAKAAGMDAAAITDFEVLHGVPAFFDVCRKNGIKPVIGMETVTDGVRLLLIAKSNAGLQSLYRISTALQEDRLSLETIRDLAKDCALVLLGIDDDLDTALQEGDLDRARAILKRLDGSEAYVAESMMDASLRRERRPLLFQLTNETGKKVLPVSYVLYEREEDVEVLQVLKSIQQNTTLSAVQAGIAWNRQFYDRARMEILYSPESLANLEELEARIDIDLDRLEPNHLPVFQNRANVSSGQWLERLAKAGLQKRLDGHVPEVYRDRLRHELDVIHSMGFDDYFLIVYDMIRFSAGHDILTGPGRGSAAGSLVAWSLGITHLDPVKDGLLFERFLNPARITMPDIDTDFPDDRREDVLAYLQEIYGSHHAVQITAFSNLKARQALRDASKALGTGDRVVEQLTKLVPNLPGMTLQKAWDTIPLFSKRIRENTNLQKIHAMARRIEGLPRHKTLHAAGVVLSREPVETVCPLVNVDGIWATQFTMEHLERFGLIKIDVLSLRNLSIIKRILERIENQEGKKVNPWHMVPNDLKTFELLERGDTLGVFQLEKEGIRQLMRQMKPRTFADVAIVLALYRPGPMQEIPVYLKNRQNPQNIRYIHPILEPILQETYGVMIYQEQIMETAVRAGGFTLSEADLLRKAMSKKDKAVMDRFEDQFVQGAKHNGIEEQTARQIFTLMERFAGYGFNKSHSYAYGMVAWVMAWLKANWPLYFYQAILDGVMGDETKTGQYLYECRQRGIPVLPADLWRSKESWAIEGNGLRMPLSIIKGLGKQGTKKILEARQGTDAEEPVQTIATLWANKVNESQLRQLIGAGALDATGYNRATLLKNLEYILNYANIVRVQNQDSLFDYSIASIPTLVRETENRLEKSRLEKEAFGFYVSEHPVAALRKRYPQAQPIQQIEDKNGYVTLLGRISAFHTHRTKKGDLMAFVTLEDETAQIDLAVMPNLLQAKRALFVDGTLIVVQGKKDRPGSVLANRVDEITNLS